jgi:hypothetical protein
MLESCCRAVKTEVVTLGWDSLVGRLGHKKASSRTLIIHFDGLVSADNRVQRSGCSGGGISQVEDVHVTFVVVVGSSWS